MVHSECRQEVPTRTLGIALALTLGSFGCLAARDASDAGNAETGPGQCEPFCGAQRTQLAPCPEGMARVEEPISFTMPAPDSIHQSDLGRPTTANFEFFEGLDGASLFPGAEIQTKPQNRMEHSMWTSETRQGSQARVSIWFASFETSQASANRYAAYTAMQIRNTYAVDTTRTLMRNAPSRAVFYLSNITSGASYSMVLSGRASQFHRGVAARLPFLGGIGAGIGRFASSQGLEVRSVGKGLTPKGGDAIFAFDPGEIERHYEATAEGAVPITVEYKSIPDVCVPSQDGLPWLRPIPVDIYFDEIRVYKASGDTWQLAPTCHIDNREQILVNRDIPAWSMGRPVEDNLLHDASRGPSGAHAGYGKYAMAWGERLMLLPGSELRCSVAGIISGGHPIPPAQFTVKIENYGLNRNTGKLQMGAYDSKADYYVDYRVEFPTLPEFADLPTQLH